MNATNKVIAKVSEIKTGTNEYGKWTLYGVHFEGSERKFGYLVSGKKPVPFVGMKVPYMEYEEEEVEGREGKIFKNYNIKELKVDETQNKPSELKSTQSGAHDDVVWKHGPCIIELMKLSRETGQDLADLIDEMKAGAYYIAKSKGMDLSQISKKPDLPSSGFDSSNIPDSEIPF